MADEKDNMEARRRSLILPLDISLQEVTSFDAQLSAHSETIQRQTKQIEDLKLDFMILQAKLVGRNDVFYLFPKLPTEIREMIWKQALPSRRVISIGVAPKVLASFLTRFPNEYPPRFWPYFSDKSREIETLFSTSYESRKVAITYESCFIYHLSRYYTVFTTKGLAGVTIPRTVVPSEQQLASITIRPDFVANMGVRFRPELDIIYWPDEVIWNARTRFHYGVKIDNILMMAMDIHALSNHLYIWMSFFELFPLLLPRLRRFIIVCNFTGSDWKSGFFFSSQHYNTPESLRSAVAKKFADYSDISIPKVEIMTKEELMASC